MENIQKMFRNILLSGPIVCVILSFPECLISHPLSQSIDKVCGPFLLPAQWNTKDLATREKGTVVEKVFDMKENGVLPFWRYSHELRWLRQLRWNFWKVRKWRHQGNFSGVSSCHMPESRSTSPPILNTFANKRTPIALETSSLFANIQNASLQRKRER